MTRRPTAALALLTLFCITLIALAQPAFLLRTQAVQSSPSTRAVVAATDPEDAQLVRPALTNPIQDRMFYFVMPDRFSNGSTANDVGNDPGGTTEADVLRHGYLPTDKGYYHGGDIQGLTTKLDYLQGLGVNAIWMTPMFKNKPVQGDGTLAGSSAAYHGYWITDFTQIDPHFGTNAELRTMIDAAHTKGIKVFFDIITNHTADVIQYAENKSDYIDKATSPYKDANGAPFDDRDFAGTNRFPRLDANTSFPYHPTFASEADKTVKQPAWLNNPIYYHNRGNSTFSGENSIYGDFFGLDDLFTENPVVAQGMTDVYKTWISDLGIDGYRIDTVKHVNIEFWQKFSAEIATYAKDHGKPDFFMYGEVFDSNPAYMSTFTTEGRLPATLDFGFQSNARSYANGKGKGNDLRDFFANDDYYTDADSNAYELPTFLGNHDMGRIGNFLKADVPTATADELLARDKLAHALMYFARGMPVVYYGDEQGFTGDGGDKDARQDMFHSQVASYNDDVLIGTTKTTAADSFDPTHPLYQSLKALSDLRTANVALQRGAQINRYSTDGPGIYAFSRIDRSERVEYVVAVNNATTVQTATFATYTPNASFAQIYPAGSAAVASDANGQITITLPSFSAVVYKANAPVPASAEAPGITISAPTADSLVSGRVEIGATLSKDALAEVTFAVKAEGESAYTVIGTDNNAPYRVFYDVSKLAPGTQLTFKAIVSDLSDHLNSAKTNVRVAGDNVVVCPAPGYAVVHYQRTAADYTGWGLYVFGDAVDPSEITTWPTNHPFVGQDSYGRFTVIKLKDGTKPVGFIVTKPTSPTEAVKDVEADRFFTPIESPEIWLKQGDAAVYTSRAAAEGFLTIHYQRTGNDYDGWGLYLFDKEGSPLDAIEKTTWPTNRPFTDTDTFGRFVRVKLQQTAGVVGFIVTKPTSPSDAVKDVEADRFITPSATGEIWLKQGDPTIYTSQPAAQGTVRVHYQRPANDYDGWGLYLFNKEGTPLDPIELTTWPTNRPFTGTDAYGRFADIKLQSPTGVIGFIVTKPDGLGNAAKDVEADRLITPATTGEVWLKQADPTVYIVPALVVPCEASANSMVTPASGGNFVSGDSSVAVSFPVGSTPVTVTLTYDKLPNPSVPISYNLALVRGFRITALDDNGAPANQLAQPYTMVISYTEADLSASGITDESLIQVLALRNGAFVRLPASAVQIDAANNRITITQTGLGEFAVVVPRRYEMYMPIVAHQ